jgi:hypothetical protein
LRSDLPIYLQYQQNPEAVQWVAEPGRLEELWNTFEP